MTKFGRVRLLQAHRHGGKDWPAGTEITLPANVAQWLVEQKVAVSIGAAANGKTGTSGTPVRRASCCGGRW